MTRTMHPAGQRSARILLTVFLVGGLLAPVLHRFTHVHVEDHRHGEAAPHFTTDLQTAQRLNFFVEERTPLQELVCDLCARLTVTSLTAEESASLQLIYLSLVGPDDGRLAGDSPLFSRTRAPPMA